MYNARTPLLPKEQGWGKKFVMSGIVAAFKIKKHSNIQDRQDTYVYYLDNFC